MRLLVLLLFPVLAVAQPAGNAQRGTQVFGGACAACHSLEPGRNLTGPSLAHIVGRKAGSLDSFVRYSPALKQSGILWNGATLDGWLRDPASAVPGNYMGFQGLPDDRARADLIAYLLAASEGKAAVPRAQGLPDLKNAPAEAVVTSLRHCRDTYFVTTRNGETRPYWEFNLRFKTDTSSSGPAPGRPVKVGQGMGGDRAQIVFHSSADISRFIKEGC